MTIPARIAQMESSRIVGGSAQTQALLRAPVSADQSFTPSGVNVTAVDAPAPVSAAAVTSNSDPVDHPTFPPTPETSPRASAPALFSSADPGMAGFDIDLEYELAALEAEWIRAGIIMNATTFFTEAANSIPPASSSSA